MKARSMGVIGGGKWGIALGEKLSQESKVLIYSRDLKSNFKKVGRLNYFSEIGKIKNAELVVIAVPSFSIREVLEEFKPYYSGQAIVGLSKGIEKKTGKLSHQIVKEVLGGVKYAHLSGPSFALEVSKNLPTKVSLALNFTQKKYFKEFFNLSNFKVELTQDIIGVEVGGAFKNIIAILSGMCDGLNCGQNFRSSLILEGFKEMIEFGKKLGAKKETFFGPAGLGDLILTATSFQSRNYRCGVNLAKKREILKIETIEGVETSYAVLYLAEKFSLSLPVVEAVFKVLYKNKSPKRVLTEFIC